MTAWVLIAVLALALLAAGVLGASLFALRMASRAAPAPDRAADAQPSHLDPYRERLHLSLGRMPVGLVARAGARRAAGQPRPRALRAPSDDASAFLVERDAALAGALWERQGDGSWVRADPASTELPVFTLRAGPDARRFEVAAGFQGDFTLREAAADALADDPPGDEATDPFFAPRRAQLRTIRLDDRARSRFVARASAPLASALARAARELDGALNAAPWVDLQLADDRLRLSVPFPDPVAVALLSPVPPRWVRVPGATRFLVDTLEGSAAVVLAVSRAVARALVDPDAEATPPEPLDIVTPGPRRRVYRSRARAR